MKILIFGGTTEGRRLAELLSLKNAVTMSVATEYGKSLIPENNAITVSAGRLQPDEMTAWLLKSAFDYVVDATHPYAAIVTENIKDACETAKTPYLRLARSESEPEQSVIYADSPATASELLKNTKGNALLTVGSKELKWFTDIEDYQSRLFVRILPMMESLQKAVELGYRNSNIICMQGPFDTEINRAIIKMINAGYLVTKDSGAAGGFKEKLEAAEQTGCKVIVITRPYSESGYTFDEILRIIEKTA